jgi:hypothetical protein
MERRAIRIAVLIATVIFLISALVQSGTFSEWCSPAQDDAELSGTE